MKGGEKKKTADKEADKKRERQLAKKKPGLGHPKLSLRPRMPKDSADTELWFVTQSKNLPGD